MPFPRGRTPRAVVLRARFLLGYVARHKWYMLLERRRHGASWRSALTHDIDKLWPDYLWLWIVRDRVEHCDRLHRARAPHHWEWWSDGGSPPRYRPMSDAARREMLTDWWAAQRMRGARDLPAWYAGLSDPERDRIGLHPSTRAWVAAQLAVG